ncbi:hypothetical protein C8R45DRAFT_906499 [Mycena sanguinolenta]|nr:hypothetical protein C8R45DRAFT_906499 [Mycena sanguinolenta]
MAFHPHTPQSQLAHDTDLLIEPFLPSSDIPHGPLAGIPQPFCLSQIASSFDSPFARGYNPVLETCVGISQDQLLSFIDGLNLAMTASPPLRVVDLAGLVIGFIPNEWAMIGGNLLQIGAEGGIRILNKSVTDRYLRTANLRLFKPRGLAVRICTSAAMRHLVLSNESDVGPSTMKKLGRGLGTVLLHAPIPYTSRIVRAIADKPPKVQPSIGGGGDRYTVPLSTQRRMAALEGHVLSVDFDVPPPVKAQGLKDKMGSWGIAFDSWVTKKRETKVEQRRQRLVRVEEQLRHQPHSPDYGGMYQAPNTDRKERKDVKKAVRRAQKRERGPGLIDSLIGPKETKLERKVAEADLLEHWASEKVLWMVVMNAEMDREIEGIERAENMNNEEHIDERTWREEMSKERNVLNEKKGHESDEDDEYYR